MKRVRADDWGLEFPVILGLGSLYDLSGGDPRNPRLAGLKSVSFAGACGLRAREPERIKIGFHRPKR